jgi:hypothetical protein
MREKCKIEGKRTDGKWKDYDEELAAHSKEFTVKIKKRTANL